jgi:hypothetical protein
MSTLTGAHTASRCGGRAAGYCAGLPRCWDQHTLSTCLPSLHCLFPTLLVPLLCCLLQVKPGPDGYRQFTEAIRRAFTLPDDSELNITFTCDEPTTGGRAVGGRVGGCGWADLVGCCSLHLQSSETVWGWGASCRPGWPAHLFAVWLSVQPRDMGRSPCPPPPLPNLLLLQRWTTGRC